MNFSNNKNNKITIQSRNWCFTDFDLLDYKVIYNDLQDIIRYICVGEETCPKTGKPHLQGWIQFVNKKRMSSVKRILGSTKIHLEPCKGSEIDNDNYCKKNNKAYELGKYIVQGERTDIETIIKMIEDGVCNRDIAKAYPGQWVRYHRGFKDYRKLKDMASAPEWRDVHVTLITGKTGCGKTRSAVERGGDNCFKIQGNQLKWFDGYNGENTLIIDEYNNSACIDTLLGLLDGYKLRLETKGSFIWARWTKVIITTNLRECQIHDQAKQCHRDALFRRINTIENLWDKSTNISCKPKLEVVSTCANVFKGNTISLNTFTKLELESDTDDEMEPDEIDFKVLKTNLTKDLHMVHSGAVYKQFMFNRESPLTPFRGEG